MEANANIGFQQFADISSNRVSLSMSGPQGILFPSTRIAYGVSQIPPSNQPPQDFEQISVLATGSGGFNPAAITGRVMTNAFLPLIGLACPPFEAAVGQGEVFCKVPPGTNQVSIEQELPDGLQSSNEGGPSFTTTFYSPPGDQPQPGSSPDIPLLPPTPQASDEPWQFPPVTVTNPDQVWWFDPEVAIGYIYTVADPAGPLFDQYTAPDLPFNDTYELLSAGGNACSTNPGDYLTPLAVITQNVPYDFATALPCFAIRGIEPANGIDPLNPLAFLAGISFDRTGLVSVSQSPITSNVVPGPLPLFGAGMAWQWSRALRQRQKRS